MTILIKKKMIIKVKLRNKMKIKKKDVNSFDILLKYY